MGYLTFGDVTRPQVGQEFIHVVVLAQGQNLGVLDLVADSAELPPQQLPSSLNIAAAGLATEPLPHLLASAGRAHVAPVRVEPVKAGTPVSLGREDFHRVAMLQLGVQGNQPAVHLGADTLVSQVGVYLVAKVDGSGARRQLHDLALRGINKDLVVEDVLLNRLDKLVGARHLPLPFQQLAQPGHLLFEPQITGLSFFVAPVGCYPVLGDLVQLVGLDLYFQGVAAIAYNGGMQRLVHVFLGVGNVVVELARDGVPQLVDNTQGFVAVLFGFHQYPEGVKVVNIA